MGVNIGQMKLGMKFGAYVRDEAHIFEQDHKVRIYIITFS